MNSDNLEAQLRQEISFLRGAKMQRDLRGHSRVPCYVLEKADTKYFMKIYPGNRVDELKDIETIYKRVQIPTAYIVDIGYIQEIHQTFCIYDFIEGYTLNELLPHTSPQQLEALGFKTGHELSKFRVITGDSKKFRATFDAELKDLFDLTCQKKQEYNQLHAEKLPEIDLARLEKSLQHLKSSIYNVTPIFVHSDINLSNVIINKNMPYIIDTEGGKINFRALDFRGNCWWCWNGHNTEREQAAYRGIYRGLFHENIPESFHQELSFTMMYQFLHRVQKYANDMEQVHYSFLRWRDNLEQTNYFENYHFDWF